MFAEDYNWSLALWWTSSQLRLQVDGQCSVRAAWKHVAPQHSHGERVQQAVSMSCAPFMNSKIHALADQRGSLGGDVF